MCFQESQRQEKLRKAMKDIYDIMKELKINIENQTLPNVLEENSSMVVSKNTDIVLSNIYALLYLLKLKLTT